MLNYEGADIKGESFAANHLMQEVVVMFQAELSQLIKAIENTSLATLGDIVRAIQAQFLSAPPTSIPSTAITLQTHLDL